MPKEPYPHKLAFDIETNYQVIRRTRLNTSSQGIIDGQVPFQRPGPGHTKAIYIPERKAGCSKVA